MVLRSAQAERAVRPYCAQSDIWPSSAIRRACGAIERTSVKYGATLLAPSLQGRGRRRRPRALYGVSSINTVK